MTVRNDITIRVTKMWTDGPYRAKECRFGSAAEAHWRGSLWAGGLVARLLHWNQDLVVSSSQTFGFPHQKLQSKANPFSDTDATG